MTDERKFKIVLGNNGRILLVNQFMYDLYNLEEKEVICFSCNKICGYPLFFCKEKIKFFCYDCTYDTNPRKFMCSLSQYKPIEHFHDKIDIIKLERGL
jgi:hypothetical protein